MLRIFVLVAALISLISIIQVIHFLFSTIHFFSNPTIENTQDVVKKGVETLVDIAMPWWLPLLGLGVVGVFVLILIAILAPQLLRM
ncbi:MAG: hypothetical protein QXU74_02440 [Candidatus Aenigmatarchaeota archaeon]